MSYFPNKSVEQIAELTDEQVTKAIDLACAEAGVPLFIEVSEKPAEPPQPEVEMYQVGEWFFAKIEDAKGDHPTI